MNKKEVCEIRKQFSPENCTITRICGCYVDHEKNKVMERKDAFLSLPEEETFKYFDIFKKTLSGSIGKNLISMEFPTEQEMKGGTQEFLMQLRADKLQDEMLLEEFYDLIIENYPFGENYYIILIHAAYDIPGKASDGMEMYDASDEVYEYLLCSLCPVSLCKPGLFYEPEKNTIADRIRDWVVDAPKHGFLFPAFTDRSTDLHSVLYYTKKSSDLQPDFISSVLGSTFPLSADEQKDVFNQLLEVTFDEHCDYETISAVHEILHEQIAETVDQAEPLALGKKDLQKVLESCGAKDNKIKEFSKVYDDVVGEKEVLLASNMTDVKKLEIKALNVRVQVDPERLDLVETKEIDGRQCLVIAVDSSVEVNGLPVRTVKRK